MDQEILKVENVTKKFPGVVALDRVSFSVRRGEVHALVGENGAGKSTLMKILAGALQPDEGLIYLKGKEVAIQNTQQARDLGISIIYQEFNLLPDLSVVQNIFLGREKFGRYPFLNYQRMAQEARDLLTQLGAEVSPYALVRELGVAQQQQVEIAKALSVNADVVIMDEPTASLGEHEVGKLFQIISSLKERGVTVIYISHRLEEIFKIADSVTVLKDGKCMGTYSVQELDEMKLVKLMVGRSFSETFPPRGKERGEVILEVKELSCPPLLKEINLKVHRGEIVGLFGLVGAGRTELAKTLFGVYPHYRGNIVINGKVLHLTSCRKAILHGISYVPEDRKEEGLCLDLSVRENSALPIIDKFKKTLFVDDQAMDSMIQRLVEALRIKTPSLRQRVKFLSGGNQQKVVLAKWLATEPRLIIFDEPTRGIDVGAKAEIYQIMRELASRGNGILMISSELPEVIGLSDRIYVMHQGKIVREFPSTEQLTEEEIMVYATGLSKV
ncbi:MAG: sugar ABC transporter ATP-binding protein [Candidatus Atribacteria bacterium]|nr:sugar ABC transporter ATP-binding protein [Candidatus Atribacteria bacterium]